MWKELTKCWKEKKNANNSAAYSGQEDAELNCYKKTLANWEK